jgi:DEAD/DEAH box helicase domain-containing protein
MTDVLGPLLGTPDPGAGGSDGDATPGGDPGPVIDAVLDRWRVDPRLVHAARLPARDARVAEPARPLPTELDERLPHRRWWSHQAQAVDLLRDGASVVLATGTASGKSLCYQVPTLEAALTGGTSLLVFPTKALARDQLLAVGRWDVPGVIAAAYDGDCTPEERTFVRRHAHLVLTNPEMLHQGILPAHERWAEWLHRLRYVVVDELHVLRGVFGTHVAQVLRRLRRLVLHHGGQEPTFVFTSATIGDPATLASELCGRPVTAVTGDGAPTGPRSVVLWNPAVDEEVDPGGRPVGVGAADDTAAAGAPQRWSVNAEAARLAADLVTAGLRTLVFCRSRRGTELVANALRQRLPGELAPLVRSYRAGYLAEERREIEHELSTGRLRALVATNALELGIDIGGLDAVVLCGFPGTVSSFWQQVGRGGRGRRSSVAVLVAGQDQLDQWMMRHPDELLGRPPEPSVINVDNPFVFVPHLACAAHEFGLRHEDLRYWPDQLDEGVRRLVIDDRATVRRRRGRPVAVWSGRGVPAPTIGLRSASRGEVRVHDDDGATIGTVDLARAAEVVHEGAVYLHQGVAWRVRDLDLDTRRAEVEPTDGATYTMARTETTIRLLESDRTRRVGRSGLTLGSVEVTSQVIGYQVRDSSSHEVLDRVDLDLPPTHLMTRAVWYRPDDDAIAEAGVAARALPGALHAMEHAAIGILPLFTICDRWDVGGVSTVFLPETAGPTVVIHDAHPGGAGIAELAYGAADRHLAATLDVVAACRCDGGCPSCVQSPKCGNGNEPLDKDAAAHLLRVLLG